MLTKKFNTLLALSLAIAVGSSAYAVGGAQADQNTNDNSQQLNMELAVDIFSEVESLPNLDLTIDAAKIAQGSDYTQDIVFKWSNNNTAGYKIKVKSGDADFKFKSTTGEDPIPYTVKTDTAALTCPQQGAAPTLGYPTAQQQSTPVDITDAVNGTEILSVTADTNKAAYKCEDKLQLTVAGNDIKNAVTAAGTKYSDSLVIILTDN